MSSQRSTVLNESGEDDMSAETTSLLKNFSSELSSYNTVGDTNNVSFVNITYTIQPKPTLCFQKPLPPKIILDNISGSMNPGINAIMGPSGGGKTTLLDVLADRKAKKGLSGHVLINGRRQPQNFKCASAYVVQDDLLMGTLSVRENLAFSAALRLPISMARKEKADKVDSVISELGLNHVANTKVGTELIRGISGGQKKRTSIGMELIISPGIVFLDEPTTGLDATTAVSVIRLLKDLSSSGRVIIMSIHQPRYSIYKLFDSLTLMSRGRMVYHGPANKALNYFAQIGHRCDNHNNPADFFLDVIIENEEADGPLGEGGNGSTANLSHGGYLAKTFEESREFLALKQHLDTQLNAALNEPKGETPQYATNFIWQFGILAARTIRNLIRDRISSGVQVFMMLGIALVVGLVFFQADDDFTGVQDRIGAMFFTTIAVAFINIPAVGIFLMERPLFVHQNVSGYYRVSSYFFAKVLCDLLPIRIIPVAMHITILYWMIGFDPDVEKFFFFMLAIVLLAMSASALAFAVSARAPVAALAIVGTSAVIILQVLFAGFLKNLRSIDDWFAWLEYLSMFRYALNAITVNELDGNDYPPGCATSNTSSTFDCLVGKDYLNTLGYLDFNIWYNILALGCFNIGFLLLAYVNLRLLKKEK